MKKTVLLLAVVAALLMAGCSEPAAQEGGGKQQSPKKQQAIPKQEKTVEVREKTVEVNEDVQIERQGWVSCQSATLQETGECTPPFNVVVDCEAESRALVNRHTPCLARTLGYEKDEDFFKRFASKWVSCEAAHLGGTGECVAPHGVVTYCETESRELVNSNTHCMQRMPSQEEDEESARKQEEGAQQAAGNGENKGKTADGGQQGWPPPVGEQVVCEGESFDTATGVPATTQCISTAGHDPDYVYICEVLPADTYAPARKASPNGGGAVPISGSKLKAGNCT